MRLRETRQVTQLQKEDKLEINRYTSSCAQRVISRLKNLSFLQPIHDIICAVNWKSWWKSFRTQWPREQLARHTVEGLLHIQEEGCSGVLFVLYLHRILCILWAKVESVRKLNWYAETVHCSLIRQAIIRSKSFRVWDIT